MTRKRRSCYAATAVVIAVVVAGVALAAASKRESLSEADARDLQARISPRQLERVGIFVTSTSVASQKGKRCVKVEMLNPTEPNRAWLRDAFGEHVCPSARPMAYPVPADRCARADGEMVAVPDVRGMPAYQAAERLRAVGLTIGCHQQFVGRVSRYAPEHLLYVEKMCDRNVPKGSAIHLRLRAQLPGGFEWLADDCEPGR